MFKENTAYVILALVAIVLIGVTIGLQIVILSDQQESPVASDGLSDLQAEPLSGQLQNSQGQAGANARSVSSESSAANVDNADRSTEQVALAISAPTDTPALIVLEPTEVQPTATPLSTSTPLPTATPAPIEPTSTPLPRDSIDEAQPEAQAAEQSAEQPEAQSIDTKQEAPTEIPTVPPTGTPVVPLATPTAQADILMGLLDRGQSCTTMTQVTARIMEEQLGVTVDFAAFSNATEMIEALAQHTIDITMCYKDPDDRQLMREFLGSIRQVGSQHMAGDGYKLQLWANDAAKAEMREQTPCVLDLLEKIDFTDVDLVAGNADTLIQANRAAIAQWLECPYQGSSGS